MTMGPVQLLVVGFAGRRLQGGDPRRARPAARERHRSPDRPRVRPKGRTTARSRRCCGSDLSPEEAEAFGAVVGALIGFGAADDEGAELGAVEGAAALEDGHVFDEEVWYVDDAIPNGTAAAVALLEHRWAIPLREGIRRAGGFHLADAWIHPADLVGIGVLAAEEAELELSKA